MASALVDQDRSELVALEQRVLSDRSWISEARCSQIDPEIFTPEKDGSNNDAKYICGRCPVRVECLAEATALVTTHGYWGGISGSMRLKLRGQINDYKALLTTALAARRDRLALEEAAFASFVLGSNRPRSTRMSCTARFDELAKQSA